jgi:hypothetical protein
VSTALFDFCKADKLLLSESGSLFGAQFRILLLELVYAARSVDKLLLAGEKRMAIRANFDADVAFMGGTGLERVLACADHVDLIVGRVYSSFHSVPFGEFPY